MSDYENENREELYSVRVRAGKRTYFFDVKETRGKDLYMTITESKRNFDNDGNVHYQKHSEPDKMNISKQKNYSGWKQFYMNNFLNGHVKPDTNFEGTVVRNYTKDTLIKYGFNRKRLLYNFDFATSHSTGFYLRRSKFEKIGFFNTKFKCSADYDVYYKLIIIENLEGVYTDKNELVGEVSSGGFSSKISFFDHLLEETKIRIDNHQNIILIVLIFINALIKKIFKIF